MDDLDAGVGHDQIAGTVSFYHLVEASLYIFFAGHIHTDGDSGQALSRQLLDQGFGSGHVHVGHHHTVTLPCHALGAGLADAGSGTGNQCRFINHWKLLYHDIEKSTCFRTEYN